MSDSAEVLACDLLIVGAGPAGLAAALSLTRQTPGSSCAFRNIIVLEKSARVGGHLLSGALVDPQAFAPLGLSQPPPHQGVVTRERLLWLQGRRAWSLPPWPPWRHGGEWMLSLGEVCRALAAEAEARGVLILTATSAVMPLWRDGRLVGVHTGPRGGQPGMRIHAPWTLLAEGCRGSLSGQVIRTLGLASAGRRATYALGIKQLWDTPDAPPGLVVHTLGGLPAGVHGGGFVHVQQQGRSALGLVVGLDYADATLRPMALFRQWCQHPAIAGLLGRGVPLAHGARVVCQGGWPAQPRLVFPGGMLLGDAAGLLDVARQQGVEGALLSGQLAARALMGDRPGDYPRWLADSSWGQRLHAVRNVREGFRLGTAGGLLHAAWEGLTGGRMPWTWGRDTSDRQCLRPLPVKAAPHQTPAAGADQRHEFLSLSRLHHREGQPAHLLRDGPLPAPGDAGAAFAWAETSFCPAGVFSWHVGLDGQPAFRVQSGNCLHCKCCDIKDPLDSWRWHPPEGGSGPDFAGL
ncbi:MAG: electron transfer flavoprotein-ubiquinone oxidoreductase [Magnetococcus sp. WYHC-3]